MAYGVGVAVGGSTMSVCVGVDVGTKGIVGVAVSVGWNDCVGDGVTGVGVDVMVGVVVRVGVGGVGAHGGT